MKRKPKRRTCEDRRKLKRIQNLRHWRDCAKRVLVGERLVEGLEIFGSAQIKQSPDQTVVYFSLSSGAEFIGIGPNLRVAARDTIRQVYRYLSQVMRLSGPNRRAKIQAIREIHRRCRKA